MRHSQSNGKSPRWGLRTRLLVPISLLVLLATIGLAVIGDFSIRQEVNTLLNQRGMTVLDGVLRGVEAEQRDSTDVVALLTGHADLVAAVEQNNQALLTAHLEPLHTGLKLGWIAVYSSTGEQLVQIGAAGAMFNAGSLLEAALAGESRSTTIVDDRGLVVMASAPITSTHGIGAVVVTGKHVTTQLLQDRRDPDGAELAIFQRGRLVDTTIKAAELRSALAQIPDDQQGAANLNQSLEDFQLQAVGRQLGSNGLLMALLPTASLNQALLQRNRMMLAGAMGFEALVLAVTLLLSRSIARPIQAIVDATGEMVQGNYGRRAQHSSIRELNELAKMVNYLAQDLEIQMAKLGRLAYRDPVSNLPNRSLFMERLVQALAHADRHRTSIAVMFLDLDNFKVVNDSLGHHSGDQMLVAVAQRLKASLRPEDTIARLGGDEFTVLLEDVNSVGDATRLAERIAERFKLPFKVSDHEVFTSVSIGIALSTPGQSHPDDLLRDADVAMYQAKLSGKAKFAVFDRSMNARAVERLELELDLRRAIGNDELRVYYQPIVDLETGSIIEAEALVRWEHPVRGLISPAYFVPLAEETGLIVQIGEWVLEQACRQAQAWQQQNPALAPLVIGVNLSARQFQEPGLVDTIRRILSETGLNPGLLKLEITESVVMADMETTIATLHRLKQLGTRLAIDDFGTGYSSLAYLKRFPIDTLKIDRSFVNELGRDPESTAIVHAILAFARALSLSTTAEGVQTPMQIQHLQELGCSRGQGYFFAKPLPEDAFSQLLQSVPHWLAEDGWNNELEVAKVIGSPMLALPRA